MKSKLITLVAMFLVANTRALQRHPFENRAKGLSLDCLCIAKPICFVILLSALGLFGPGNTWVQESVDLGKWLQETEEELVKVDNYIAIFHRIEFVDGKLLPEEVTVLKFKRPFIFRCGIRTEVGG